MYTSIEIRRQNKFGIETIVQAPIIQYKMPTTGKRDIYKDTNPLHYKP